MGCREDAGPLSTMYVAVESGDFEPAGFEDMIITIDTPLDSRTIVYDDFSVTPSVPIPRTEPFFVSNRGRAIVDFRLAEEGSLVASGSTSIQLRPNTAWGLRVFRGSHEPECSVFCDGIDRIPISSEHQREPGDAIWIRWAGQQLGTQANTIPTAASIS